MYVVLKQFIPDNNITASLTQQIENQINPPILIQQAPWL
jgi:hypothetical protein